MSGDSLVSIETEKLIEALQGRFSNLQDARSHEDLYAIIYCTLDKLSADPGFWKVRDCDLEPIRIGDLVYPNIAFKNENDLQPVLGLARDNKIYYNGKRTHDAEYVKVYSSDTNSKLMIDVESSPSDYVAAHPDATNGEDDYHKMVNDVLKRCESIMKSNSRYIQNG